MVSENFRGALLMIFSMVFFAVEDVFVKLLTQGLPYSQVLALLGFLGFGAFAIMLKAQGEKVWTPDLLQKPVVIRNIGEIIGSIGFTTAIALGDFSSTSAILQALPLAITLGAALFLGEPVGWRRWSAISVGFLGVLLVVRPGLAGFQPISIMALLAVVGLALRDLSTRMVPKSVHSHQVAASAFFAIGLAGVIMALVLRQPFLVPSFMQWVQFFCCMGVGVVGYALLVAATRVGQASALAPYRYTRLVFALAMAYLVFHEHPDALTLIGAAVIVASGSYTMWREAHVRNRRAREAGFVTPGT